MLFLFLYNHGIDIHSLIAFMDQPLKEDELLIENNCCIGNNVCILLGVYIGDIVLLAQETL